MRTLILTLTLLLSLSSFSEAGDSKMRHAIYVTPRRMSYPSYVVWTSSRIGIHKSHIPIGRFNIPIYSPVIRRRHDVIRIPISR